MLSNSGLITTDGTLRLRGDTLTNQGEINGVSLSSDYLSLTNTDTGRLLADDRLTLNGTAFANAGTSRRTACKTRAPSRGTRR